MGLRSWFNKVMPKHERIAFSIETAMEGIERAANVGRWEEVSRLCVQQELLLKQYQMCEDERATEEFLENLLKSRNRVRAVKDEEYSEWISSELFKRNLMPM
jgi:hypothetical protein